jgi:tetratricopeptide (TPR) repeat protein
LFKVKYYPVLIVYLLLISSCESELPLTNAKKKLELGDSASAVFYLKEVLTTDSLNKYANEFLANYYFSTLLNKKSEKLDSAIHYLQILHSIDDTDIYYLKKIASAYSYSGNYLEAIKAYRKLILRDPQDAGYHYNIGLSKRKLEDPYGAIASFSEALKISPKYQEALYQRAEVADMILTSSASRKENQSGIADYRFIYWIKPDTWPIFVKNYSQGALSIMKDLDNLLTINPNHIGGKYLRSQVFKKCGNYVLAIKELDDLIINKPENGSYYLERGFNKYLSGRKNEACEDLSNAFELGSEVAIHYINENCK